jgi:hypothetical protein
LFEFKLCPPNSGWTTGNTVVPTTLFRPIRRLIRPDFIVDRPKWRCSYGAGSHIPKLSLRSGPWPAAMSLCFPRHSTRLDPCPDCEFGYGRVLLPLYVRRSIHLPHGCQGWQVIRGKSSNWMQWYDLNILQCTSLYWLAQTLLDKTIEQAGVSILCSLPLCPFTQTARASWSNRGHIRTNTTDLTDIAPDFWCLSHAIDVCKIHTFPSR